MTLPLGYLSGFTISNDAVSPATSIDIAAGVARDAADANDIILAAPVIKSFAATWVAGNGGILDAAEPSDAYIHPYQVYAIFNPTTLAVDAIASLATSPALPVGWTSLRRCGMKLRQGGVNIPDHRYGSKVVLDGVPLAIAVSETTSPSLLKLFGTGSPSPGIQFLADVAMIMQINSASNSVYVYSPDQVAHTPNPPSVCTLQVAASIQLDNTRESFMSDTQGQLGYCFQHVNGALLNMQLHGWDDYL